MTTNSTILQFNKPSQIVNVFNSLKASHKGSIFISNFPAASNLSILNQNNIKAVITVARGAFLQHTKQQLPNYLYLPADDIKDFDISQYFEKTNHFIQKNITKSNVLVHCMFGKSRSATIIIAYLIKKYKMGFQDSWTEIRRHRQCIKPNSGFRQLLIQYQKSLLNNDKTSKFKIIQTFEKTKQFEVFDQRNIQSCQRKRIKLKQLEQNQDNILLQSNKEVIDNQNDKTVNNYSIICLQKQNEDIMKRIQDLKQKCKNKIVIRSRVLTIDQIKSKYRRQMKLSFTNNPQK